MNHLGALITPYVDGELGPARAALARAHVAECEECAHAVSRELAARRRTQQSVSGVQASPELTARLLALPSDSISAGSLTFDGRPAARPRLAPLVLGGGGALVGLLVLTLFVLGSPRPAETPSTLLGATAASTTTLAARPYSSLTSLDSDSMLAGWAVPSGLPATQVEMHDDGDQQTLDVTFRSVNGHVRVLERSGSLNHEAVVAAGRETVAINGHVAYLVDGWYLLESGSCVVAVYGEPEAAEAVIAQLPPADQSSVLDRLGDGWHVLVG